jgi:putative phosphoribosyl transferase
LVKEVVRFSLNSSVSNLFVEGNLFIPDNPIGIVVFAHGSGSSKTSQRNQLVSRKLNENNIGSLLFDLLSEEEQESDRRLENIIPNIPGAILNKFNISLLTKRLSMATEWIVSHQQKRKLQLGYFASSTGGAAALIAASKYQVKSIVIRSGRTDLVDSHFLSEIVSPCLFIAGSKEKALIKINKQTMKKLRNVKEKKLSIIQNASHLFDEEGSTEKLADIASRWLKEHFSPLSNSVS